jgi:hypothetical protein
MFLNLLVRPVLNYQGTRTVTRTRTCARTRTRTRTGTSTREHTLTREHTHAHTAHGRTHTRTAGISACHWVTCGRILTAHYHCWYLCVSLGNMRSNSDRTLPLLVSLCISW